MLPYATNVHSGNIKNYDHVLLFIKQFIYYIIEKKLRYIDIAHISWRPLGPDQCLPKFVFTLDN